MSEHQSEAGKQAKGNRIFVKRAVDSISNKTENFEAAVDAAEKYGYVKKTEEGDFVSLEKEGGDELAAALNAIFQTPTEAISVENAAQEEPLKTDDKEIIKQLKKQEAALKRKSRAEYNKAIEKQISPLFDERITELKLEIERLKKEVTGTEGLVQDNALNELAEKTQELNELNEERVELIDQLEKENSEARFAEARRINEEIIISLKGDYNSLSKEELFAEIAREAGGGEPNLNLLIAMAYPYISDEFRTVLAEETTETDGKKPSLSNKGGNFSYSSPEGALVASYLGSLLSEAASVELLTVRRNFDNSEDRLLFATQGNFFDTLRVLGSEEEKIRFAGVLRNGHIEVTDGEVRALSQEGQNELERINFTIQEKARRQYEAEAYEETREYFEKHDELLNATKERIKELEESLSNPLEKKNLLEMTRLFFSRSDSEFEDYRAEQKLRAEESKELIKLEEELKLYIGEREAVAQAEAGVRVDLAEFLGQFDSLDFDYEFAGIVEEEIKELAKLKLGNRRAAKGLKKILGDDFEDDETKLELPSRTTLIESLSVEKRNEITEKVFGEIIQTLTDEYGINVTNLAFIQRLGEKYLNTFMIQEGAVEYFRKLNSLDMKFFDVESLDSLLNVDLMELQRKKFELRNNLIEYLTREDLKEYLESKITPLTLIEERDFVEEIRESAKEVIVNTSVPEVDSKIVAPKENWSAFGDIDIAETTAKMSSVSQVRNERVGQYAQTKNRKERREGLLSSLLNVFNAAADSFFGNGGPS